MRLLPLLLLVACTDLPVDEWDGDVDDADTNVPPTHPLEDCPGNAPGGPVEPPGGRPIAKEKKCGNEPTRQECLECCDWNFRYVWGEKCNRIKNERKRRLCWEEAENYKRPDCQANCRQPIFDAIGPTP